MKKNKFKKYLKLGIFLLGISLLLVNCEDDNTESKSKYLVKKINHSQVMKNQKIASKLANYRTLIEKEKGGNYQERLLHSDDYDFTIDTDRVMYLENNETGYHSYSFYLIRDNPVDNKLENLVLSLNQDGEYDTYIYKYGFSIDEYDTLYQEELNLRETLITPIDFDTSVFNDEDFSDDSQLGKVIETSEGFFICEEEWIGITSPENFEVETWVLEDTHCTFYETGGGGGSSDGPSSSNNSGVHGGGSSSNNNSQISTTPSLPNISEETTPCENLLNMVTTATVKGKVNILKNHSLDTSTEGEKEAGFRLQKSTTGSFIPSRIGFGSNGGINKHVNIIPTSYTIAVFHTHPPNPPNDVFAMFSPQDILYLARMVNTINNSHSTNNINPLNLTMFLIVDGMTFAIRFDDTESIQNLLDIYNNSENKELFKDNLQDDYEKDNNIYTGETATIGDQQHRLLRFLNRYNLNISLYQATYSNNVIDGWDKFKDDGSKEPCN